MSILAVSPDGKQFAYSTNEGLFLRSVGELDARLIAGTANEKAAFPFFSPDGKWIGYGSGGQLKRIAIGGGAPVALCDTKAVIAGGSWGEDNTIVYAVLPGGIMRVSANGGTPESLFKAKSGVYFSLPQILPDGKSVLFTKTIMAPLSMQIVVQSPGSESPKELFVGYQARYLPTGHIAYTVGNNILDIGGHNLFAIPFDLERLEVTGGSVPLVENIRGPYGIHFAISDAGTLVYMPGSTGALLTGRTLVWVDKDGKEESISAPPKIYAYPKISPDGTRVALTISPDGLTSDIWIWDFIRKSLTRLTYDKTSLNPIWTSDSIRIAYGTTRDGRLGTYWKAADGTGKEDKLCSEPNRSIFPLSFSNDGKNLVVTVIEGEVAVQNTKWDLGVLSMEGEHALKPLLHERPVETQAQVSPDGRWLAYASDESTGEALKTDVYVRPFPEVDKGKWQASTNGGSCPRWSPDGRELYYLSGDKAVMAVPVQINPTFSLGTPIKLFQSNYVGVGATEGVPWDVSRDGKRFLMIKEPLATSQSDAAGAPRKINIVLNWLEELKQRVRVK
jgi:Tol biopolymer transport system component